MVDRDIFLFNLYIPKATAKRIPKPRNDFRIGIKIDFVDRISEILLDFSNIYDTSMIYYAGTAGSWLDMRARAAKTSDMQSRWSQNPLE